MKKVFLWALLSAFISNSSGQTNCPIKRAYAYYTVSFPGVQMADENGNPITPKPDITRFIYVECSGVRMPEIKSVLYNNISFLFTLTKVNSRSVSLSNKFNNNQNITITARKGNTLWKIDLLPPEADTVQNTDCKNIIIKTKVTGKLCKFYIKKETNYIMPPRY